MQISVAGVDDLKERTVRVSGEGQIELPLIGNLQVNGLTEAGVRDKISAALTKYMYNPQVDVFVKEYHSRQVAVVGAVRTPGLIMLTGGESILDAITQAGGMTADAADEIVILPENKGGRTKLMELASSYEAGPKPGEDPGSATAARNMPNEPPAGDQYGLDSWRAGDGSHTCVARAEYQQWSGGRDPAEEHCLSREHQLH